MKNLKLLWAVCLIVLGGTRSFSQDPKIELELWTESELIPLDEKSSIRLVSSGETTMLPIKQGSFIVSDSLKKEDQKIIFNLNGYELAYDSIPLAWNPLQPKWTIKIDAPPFSDENKYLIKKSEKTPQLIYLFDNGAGATFTGYKYENTGTPRQRKN